MKTNPTNKSALPTKPGPYWWKAKDGDEWKTVIEIVRYGDRFQCLSLNHPELKGILSLENFHKHYPGQWVTIPTPDEIEKLEGEVKLHLERSKLCDTMDKAEKLALIRALQEIRDETHLLGDGVSPREIVQAVKKLKAVTPDEGYEAWQLYNKRGGAVYAYGKTETEAISSLLNSRGFCTHKKGQVQFDEEWAVYEQEGYTCRKVRVVEVVE